MQRLPDLTHYRSALISEGAPDRLPMVPRLRDLSLPEGPAGTNCWPWRASDHERDTIRRAKYPRITVVTPSFQQGSYLEATLRSVLLQDYPNLEYIVIDGGSTDDSLSILEKYRPHLSYVRCGKDRGQSHAINMGFSLGSGDVFAWLNSDDCYLPNTLQLVANAWLNGAEFVYGDHLEIKNCETRFTYHTAGCVSARYLRHPGLFAQPSAFWSSNKHVPIWEDMICAMDYELWVRLLPGSRIRYIPQALSVTRAHDEAKTHSERYQQHWQADAGRNFAAHPQLFADNRWLQYEFRAMQKLTRWRRARHRAIECARIAAQCGWNAVTQ